MSHGITAQPCNRRREAAGGAPTVTSVSERLTMAAAAADQIAAAVEREILRLDFVSQDAGELPAIAGALGAIHGDLDEIGHALGVKR